MTACPPVTYERRLSKNRHYHVGAWKVTSIGGVLAGRAGGTGLLHGFGVQRYEPVLPLAGGLLSFGCLFAHQHGLPRRAFTIGGVQKVARQVCSCGLVPLIVGRIALAEHRSCFGGLQQDVSICAAHLVEDNRAGGGTREMKVVLCIAGSRCCVFVKHGTQSFVHHCQTG